MLRRNDQLAWAWLLGIFLLALSPRIYRVLVGQWVSLDHPPREAAQFVVDINRADWPELALLPGIGEITARRIVEHRQKYGPFSSVDDLIRVPGIGQKTVAQLRRFVVIGPSGEAASESL
jgi:competence protein ComEA